MKVFYFFIFLIITIATLISFLIFNSSKNISTVNVEIRGKNFEAFVAKNPKDKEIGLSRFKNIKENQGMLFLFEKEDYYAFWMKDMKFPIDIIYIRENKIVDIYQNVKNPKDQYEKMEIIKPKEASDMVFEINANISKKNGLRIGDFVRVQNL